MHGRPRQKAGPPDPERVKAAQQKATLFGTLTKEVLERRRAGRYDAESLALSAKLLELHPEVYTAWNYRREAIQEVLAGGGAAAVEAVRGELALTEHALRKNPKSYATWHHRKWVVAKGFCSLEAELVLVGQLLDADERNFHGWGYRRFVVQLMGTPAARELEYAEKKINQNFSNYSAWHSRTALLPVLHGGGGGSAGDDAAAAAAAEALSAALAAGAQIGVGGQESRQEGAEGEGAEAAAQLGSSWTSPDHPPAQQQEQQREQRRRAAASSAAATSAVPKDALDAEYELVKQAFYTEPEDQSGWFYHRWLLGCSLAHWEEARGTAGEAAERAALLAVLRQEQQTCEELLEIEPDAKWPLLTLTRLKELQHPVLNSSSSTGSSSQGSGAVAAPAAAGAAAEGGDADLPAGLAADVAAGYARLVELDPLRRGYYQDALDGGAYVVAKPSAPSA